MTITVPSNTGPRGGRLVGIRASESPPSPTHPCLRDSISLWLFEQFAQLQPLCLVTWMLSVLSFSSLCSSHLAHLGKKANLVQKAEGPGSGCFLCSCIPGAGLLPASLQSPLNIGEISLFSFLLFFF